MEINRRIENTFSEKEREDAKKIIDVVSSSKFILTTKLIELEKKEQEYLITQILIFSGRGKFKKRLNALSSSIQSDFAESKKEIETSNKRYEEEVEKLKENVKKLEEEKKTLKEHQKQRLKLKKAEFKQKILQLKREMEEENKNLNDQISHHRDLFLQTRQDEILVEKNLESFQLKMGPIIERINERKAHYEGILGKRSSPSDSPVLSQKPQKKLKLNLDK